jgi:IS30 family transposase
LVYVYVFEKLRSGWAPEQISGRLKKESGQSVICHETIYRFIYDSNNRDKRLWEYLPRKQKGRRKQNGRGVHKVRIPQRVSIHLRPTVIDLRTEFGHWEGDTVEGKRSDRDGIHTEVERLSRLILARKVETIDSPKTLASQMTMFSRLPGTARRSTTLDNGRENHLHFGLTDKLGMRTFFADPYSSWQRATNENSNGLLRRYLTKGASFRDLTQEELDDIVWEINNRPRKCLEYNTPREVFEKHLRGCTLR